MKDRSGLLAFVSYLLCPPAALLYYIGAPSLVPVEVIQFVPKPERGLFSRKPAEQVDAETFAQQARP